MSISTQNKLRWRPVKNYTDRYWISEVGKVWSIITNQTLTPHKNRRGYLQVGLKREGVRVTRRIHRLVAEAFIGPRPTALVIDHINNNKIDNAATNLRYITNRANLDRGSDSSKEYLITCPEGSDLQIKNLSKFCREHQLSVSHMVSVASGRRNHHRQFKCRRL